LYHDGRAYVHQKGVRPSLPRQRAFVVQFGAEAALEARRYAGRVEHVASGQAVHFHSLEQLLAFIARVLTEVPTAPDGS
jgi:hypothetical protein